MIWLLAADAILLLHFGFVLFVILGLVLILLGGLCHWPWTRNRHFRFAHLLAIAVVVTQSWLGQICPLTLLEQWLRRQGGGPSYSGSFVGHWVESLLYYRAPDWVFILAYSLFGLLVLLAWWRWPPRQS
ncbi:DUF2784 domain-containing protein [Ferrimonas marina]|nr:DUF2784 domain-containing protein [Ferrimonas marina]